MAVPSVQGRAQTCEQQTRVKPAIVRVQEPSVWLTELVDQEDEEAGGRQVVVRHLEFIIVVVIAPAVVVVVSEERIEPALEPGSARACTQALEIRIGVPRRHVTLVGTVAFCLKLRRAKCDAERARQ